MEELKVLVPGWLDELRADLAEAPLVRRIFVTPTERLIPRARFDFFRYSLEKYPNLRGYMQLLEGHGLVTARLPGWDYQINERLVRLLQRPG